ncbi:sensor histidine kinase [Paenibacillus mendelii]|uniref:Sensor histidine kinase n=1 Tax=Paenibacillus mendelii TaxID=206163 RepID=A0ABV6J9H9_9BACL|nr:histidine kinase [Paenibacillus mendelii]MCQ6559861.1 histidine kinase [Paenibacillus mendelii]
MRKLANLKLSKLHVYQRVIIVFVAMLVPVYLISLGINMWGLSFMKKGFTNSISSNVQFYSDQLNEQFTFVRRLQLQLANDSDLLKMSFLGGLLNGFDDLERINRVKDRLFAARDSSDYLVNVGVYVRSYGRTISTQGGIMKLPNNDFKMISRFVSQKPAQPIFMKDGRLFFIEPVNNRSIIVYMELSVPKLTETLSKLVGLYDDSGALLMDGQNDSVVSVRAADPVVEQIRASAEIRNETPQSSNHYMLKVENEDYMVTQIPISALGLSLNAYMNQDEVTGPLRMFNVWLIVLSLVSLAIVVMFSFSVNVMIHRPLLKLIKAFKKLETDNLIGMRQGNNDNEFGYLYRNFDSMVSKLKHSIHENYEQTLALQHSEFKQLQSQINPHFLYNSFFNIYMICRSGDVDGASLLAQKLGSYYQFITRSGKDDVPLIEEYRHALDYCEIQGIRFSNRIVVEAEELPESCQSLELPRLIVQPLVENAFEHAFENGRRRGMIVMKVSYSGSRLSIYVEDDGNVLPDEQLLEMQSKLANTSLIAEKTGLFNVCRRVQLRFGKQSGVFVSRSPLGGLKAEILIYDMEG